MAARFHRVNPSPSSIPVFPRWLKSAGATALLALATCSGNGGSQKAEGVIIAKIGERSVHKAEFDAYLAEALGGSTELEGTDTEVKSRLLDQFLDEELLLTEAEQQKLTITDAEAAANLPGRGADPKRVQRVMLLKRFKEEVILKGITVSDEEIRQHFQTHLADYQRPATAVLRKVLLDSEEQAKSVHQELAAHPEQFERIAETR